MNKIKYKYIGNGAFVVGLPARDIREDEAAEFEELIEANMETPNPCYRMVGERTQADHKKEQQRKQGAEESN